MAYECGPCHLKFGSLKAFDLHRVGDHEYTFREGLDQDPPVYDGRRCLGIDELEESVIFELNSRGHWSLASSIEYGRSRRGSAEGVAQSP